MREKSIRLFKYIILGYGLLYLVFSQLVYEYLYYKTFKNMVGYIVLSLGLYYFFKQNKQNRSLDFRCTSRKDTFIITILVLGSRLYMIDSIQILQTSDFSVYLNESISYLQQGHFSESLSIYFGAIGNNGLILVIFSKIFALLGIQLRIGLIVNTVFVLLTIYIMYFLIKRIFSQKLALWVCVVYAVFPSYLAYCIFFGSEPMYIFFLVLGVYFVIYSIIKIRDIPFQETKKLNIIILLLGIFIIAFSQKLRPISMIFVASICICIFLFYKQNYRSKIIFIIISFFVANFIISNYIYKPDFIISKPTYGWTLYEGSNLYTYGEWSKETSDFLFNTIENNRIEDVQKVLLDEAIKNVSSYDIFTILKLYSYKAARLFGNSNGFSLDIRNLYRDSSIFGENYIEYGQVPAIFNFWMLFSTLFYKITICFTVYGLLKSMLYLRKNENEKYVNTMIALILPINGLTVLHTITVCIQRYNVPVIPLLIFMAIHTLIYGEKEDIVI